MNVPQKNGGIKTGDEMTNANNIDTNVIAKSPKLTCCELLWLRVRNGKMKRKKLSLFIRNRSVPFHKDQC